MEASGCDVFVEAGSPSAIESCLNCSTDEREGQ